MTPGNKPFDAVQMMRSIRDELNEQIKGMTFEQEHAWIRKQLHEQPKESATDDSSPNQSSPKR